MKFLKPFLTLIFATFAMAAFAQPGGNLGQVEMSVTDKYKAKVGEAVKYNDQPKFEDTTTSKIPVSYKIVSQPIEVKYKPEPISPARISQVPVEELFNGMVKGGFGLYGTPLVEAYWNSGRSSNHNYGFWGKHYSTQKGVKETVYEKNGLSQNSLGGYYNHFYRNFTWESKLYANWDKYTYYGVDDFPDTLDYQEDRPREADYNWYKQYGVSTTFKGKEQKDLGWVDQVGLDYYNFSDLYNGKENYVKVGSDWELPAGSLNLNLDLDGTYFQTNFDSIVKGQQSYFTLQTKPTVEIAVNDLLFDFGINLYFNNYESQLTGGEFNLFFFPELNIKFPFVKDVLSLYGGVKGQLQHNTFRHLTLNNPYVVPGDTLRPTCTTDVFLGLEGILSSTTSFNVKGGFLVQKNRALYYRNPLYRQFIDSAMVPGLDVRYDNMDVFYVRGELASNINDNLQLGLFGELRGYSTEGEVEAWYLPSFIAGLNADYTIREKIKLGTEINYVGKREAFVQENNTEIESTLPGYTDVALDVEYLYNSRLSAFIGVSNLLSRKYDIYLGYKAQSINFLMGFAYKF